MGSVITAAVRSDIFTPYSLELIKLWHKKRRCQLKTAHFLAFIKFSYVFDIKRSSQFEVDVKVCQFCVRVTKQFFFIESAVVYIGRLVRVLDGVLAYSMRLSYLRCLHWKAC